MEESLLASIEVGGGILLYALVLMRLVLMRLVLMRFLG